MLEEHLTAQEGGAGGVFRVVKHRCAGKGDTVKEDPVEAKKKGVKWADWRPETVRIIKLS